MTSLRIKSITYKWVFNFIITTAIILFATNFIFFVAMKRYLYKYAEQLIKSSSMSQHSLIFSNFEYNNKNVEDKIKESIENFKNYDNILLIGVNFNGDIVASSTKLTAYGHDDANFFRNCTIKSMKKSEFIQTAKLNKNEHIMAYVLKSPILSNNIPAIIYITSLNKVDKIIKDIVFITLSFSFIILLLTIISGVFFIKYFVNPVRKINVVIRKIAAGNMKYRINKNFHYEIKDLCTSINFMADEICKGEYLKNEFISSISHELRTPLTAIMGWSETILNTKSENEEILKKGINIIYTEVTRLSNMVEELLDFSRIQSGHFKLKKEKTDLFAELQYSVIVYQDIAKKEGKILEYNEELNALPIIFGDKNKIRQVFINLIDNAIKYSEKGDKIIINANVVGDIAKIEVKDTGCGINKEDLPHITEKFFKANTTKKGSGIGLAVVKAIVEQHRGRLNFKSEIKKGTTATVEFNLYNET